jgi:hypothetical protein
LVKTTPESRTSSLKSKAIKPDKKVFEEKFPHRLPHHEPTRSMVEILKFEASLKLEFGIWSLIPPSPHTVRST